LFLLCALAIKNLHSWLTEFSLSFVLTAVLSSISAFLLLDSSVSSLAGVAVETSFHFRLMQEVCRVEKFVITSPISWAPVIWTPRPCSQ
jgi:hypothetical protein